MSKLNDLIYIPTQGLPILIPKDHRWATNLLDKPFEYLSLPGKERDYLIYVSTENNSQLANTWLSNIFRGVGSSTEIMGPVLVLCLSEDSSLIKPDNDHILEFQKRLVRRLEMNPTFASKE